MSASSLGLSDATAYKLMLVTITVDPVSISLSMSEALAVPAATAVYGAPMRFAAAIHMTAFTLFGR